MWQMKVFEDSDAHKVEKEFNAWMATHHPLNLMVSQSYRPASGIPGGTLCVVVTYQEGEGPGPARPN